MKKEQLISSAKELKPINNASLEEYKTKMSEIKSAADSNMLQFNNLTDLIGEDNVNVLKDNNANHVRFMSSIFANYDAKVFVETVLWVYRTYKSHEFSESYFPKQLETWNKIIKHKLSEESSSEILVYYDWMLKNHTMFNQLS